MKYRIDKVRGGYQLIEISADGAETKLFKPYRTLRGAETALMIQAGRRS